MVLLWTVNLGNLVKTFFYFHRLKHGFIYGHHVQWIQLYDWPQDQHVNMHVNRKCCKPQSSC